MMYARLYPIPDAVLTAIISMISGLAQSLKSMRVISSTSPRTLKGSHLVEPPSCRSLFTFTTHCHAALCSCTYLLIHPALSPVLLRPSFRLPRGCHAAANDANMSFPVHHSLARLSTSQPPLHLSFLRIPSGSTRSGLLVYRYTPEQTKTYHEASKHLWNIRQKSRVRQ